MRVEKIFALCVVAILVGCTDDPTDNAMTRSALSQEPCAVDHTFTAWCDYKNPEDIAATPDNQFLLATGFGGLPDPYLNEMTITDLSTMSKRPVDIVLKENTWGEPSCTRSTTDFSTHGLDIVSRGSGEYMVAVTNHLPKETIEFFELASNAESWTLIWRGCVESPTLDSGEHLPMFNDVALTSEGNFYVSEMYNAKVPFEDLISAGIEEKDTGVVWFWSAAGGFEPIPGTKGSFPNGIVFDQMNNTLFVNYWFSGITIRFDIESGEIQASHLGGRADNLTLANGSVWTAKHDMTVEEYLESCPPDSVNCFLPFSVHELDLIDLREKNTWKFDSEIFGFGTVATPVAGQVWLGSAHGDRIARINLQD